MLNLYNFTEDKFENSFKEMAAKVRTEMIDKAIFDDVNSLITTGPHIDLSILKEHNPPKYNLIISVGITGRHVGRERHRLSRIGMEIFNVK